MSRGWFVEKPSKVGRPLGGRGVLALVGGVLVIVGGVNVAGLGTRHDRGRDHRGLDRHAGAGRQHAAVTMAGAMIRAMLAAYRRTLQKTMEQARSMQQVVDEAGLDWLDTPDQAVVWGTALGLQGQIEHVLDRSLEDLKRARLRPPRCTSRPGTRRRTVPRSPTAPRVAGSGASLFSDSAVPDLGGMMSALGTIGNSPSSSGSGGGGGGFSGGSSGGGGGGAGGGF